MKILTNSATPHHIFSGRADFLHELKAAIEEAMRAPDAATYQINTTEHKIDKIDMTHTTVSNSPGANTIGGDARNVKQSSHVTIGQGLQDISALIDCVERSQLENALQLKTYLEIVRSNLAGGSPTKEEAKSA